MSLDEYQRALARMVSNPDYRRVVAGDPEAALAPLQLDPREKKRLAAFSVDPGMRVNTVLYRANRLAPIYAAMPRTCAALGDTLSEVLRGFWTSNELEDLQFPNEVARFVTFLRLSGAQHVESIPGLLGLIALEHAISELLLLPRRNLRQEWLLQGGDNEHLHPLLRFIPVDVDPSSLIAVVECGLPLAECIEGAGGVLVDHRQEPGTLLPLSVAELDAFTSRA